MCDLCEWKVQVKHIDVMAKKTKFRWAYPMLIGIRFYAKTHEHLTERQIAAVTNIGSARR